MALNLGEAHAANHLLTFVLHKLGAPEAGPMPNETQLGQAMEILSGSANRRLMAGLSAERVREMLDSLTAGSAASEDTIAQWVALGRANPWIAEADDPAFGPASFTACATAEELRAKLEHGNWCLGQAFHFRDLCLINQVDGGDEWLTIRHGIAFESINFLPIIARGEFEQTIQHLLAATEQQCRECNWRPKA